MANPGPQSSGHNVCLVPSDRSASLRGKLITCYSVITDAGDAGDDADDDNDEDNDNSDDDTRG